MLTGDLANGGGDELALGEGVEVHWLANRVPSGMPARKCMRGVELRGMTETVASLTEEIERIVAERQELRASGVGFDVL